MKSFKDIFDPHIELIEQTGRGLHFVSVDDVAGVFVPDHIHCREEHDADQDDGDPYFEKEGFSPVQQFSHNNHIPLSSITEYASAFSITQNHGAVKNVTSTAARSYLFASQDMVQ